VDFHFDFSVVLSGRCGASQARVLEECDQNCRLCQELSYFTGELAGARYAEICPQPNEKEIHENIICISGND